MEKFLGLDLGSRTLGIAISESGIIANALTTIRFKEDEYEIAADELVNVIKEHKITKIVLGLPKHMNNDLGIRGEISIRFKELLEEKCEATIILWDERLSTKSALSSISKQTSNKNVRKEKKDEIAAVIILQNYLDANKK